MAKWADYLISGVYFDIRNGSKYISHVQLHTQHDDGDIDRGIKSSKEEVIKWMRLGKTVETILWNYRSTLNLSRGARVGIIQVDDHEYLRTDRDTTSSDNLDNLINMTWLVP